MAKTKYVHRCADCGTDHPKWAGQCSGCGAWATLQEVCDQPEPTGPTSGWSGGAAVPFADVAAALDPVEPTGLDELDRALGGGLVPGSVTLLGGEPGIGKSTLLLQVAAAASVQGRRVLYVSAEESAAQLRRRAGRLDLQLDHVWVLAETALPKILQEVARLEPRLLLVDSIQTVSSPQVASVPGSVTQVRDCTQGLLEVAKQGAISTLLVGHVTKEGTLAGPRTLEHLVDTVLSFEGDRHQRLRFLRAAKHRFGSTGEPGVLEMTGKGLVAVPDPSGVFLTDRLPGAIGSVVVPVLDGQRPLLVELQALVAPSRAMTPRRSAHGVEVGRLSMLLAVLERRLDLRMLSAEAYVSVVGGVRVNEPGTDLAIVLALTSALLGWPLREDLVVCGEVGLAGEIRQVAQLDRRLHEAARLGYDVAIVPQSVPQSVDDAVDGMELWRASTIKDAVRLAGLEAALAAVANA